MTEDEQPKTALELQVEQLQKDLSAMKDSYEAQIKEYKDANKGLWAELHQVPEDAPEPMSEPSKEFDMDKAVETFNAYYGVKKE
jgi:hypothetical protein